MSWIGSASGDFDNAANWSTGLVPGAGDDVTINVAPNIIVTHSAGSDSIHSLTTANGFVLSGGTLTVATTFQTSTVLTLSGGTLAGATVSGAGSVVATSSGGTLDGVTVNGTIDLSQNDLASLDILNDLTLNGTALVGSSDGTGSGSIHFLGASQTLAGTGEIRFGANPNNVVSNDSNVGGTLTIGSGITIDGASGTVENAISNDTIIFDGTFNADTPGDTITLTGGFVQDGGIVGASNGGALTVLGTFDLGTSSVVNIGIGSGGAGQYNVTQSAVLAGTLNVSLIGGFVPTQGDVYTIGTYGSATGSFAFTGLTAPGVTLTPSTTSTAVTLTVTQGAPPPPAPPVATVGGLDPTFGTNGLVSHDVGFASTSDLLIQSDGKSVLIGVSDDSGTPTFAAARYNADGSVDTSFGVNGVVDAGIGSTSDQAAAGAILPNGDILIAGTATTLVNGQSTGSEFGLVEFTSAGVLDTSFGNGTGEVLTSFSSVTGTLSNDFAHALVVTKKGTIYVAGSSDAAGQGQDFAIAAYNSDGTHATSFGGTGQVMFDFLGGDDSIASLALQANGDLVAAGSAINPTNGISSVALARFLPNGSDDVRFGAKGKVMTSVGGVDDGATSVAIGPRQQIFAAGFSATGSAADGSLSSDFLVLRYTTAGVLDRTFGSGGTVVTSFGQPAAATRILVAADGTVVASGKTTESLTTLNASQLDLAIARYTAKGQLDTTFNGSGQAIVTLGTPSLSPGFAHPAAIEEFSISPLDATSDLLAEFTQLVQSDQGVVAATTGGQLLIAGNSGDNTVEAAIVSSGADLTLTLLSNPPASVVGNSKGSVLVKVVELGPDTAMGAATIQLFTATGSQVATGQMAFQTYPEKLNLRHNQPRTFRLNFSYPDPLQTGAFQLLATVDLTGKRDLNEGNNTAAAPVSIAKSIVQLTATSFTAPSFVGTRPATVKLDIMNSGNTTALGLSAIQFFASTDGTIANATPMGTPPARFNIRPNTTHPQIERIAVPAALAAGNYFLIALLDPANVLKEPFTALDMVTSSNTFAVG